MKRRNERQRRRRNSPDLSSRQGLESSEHFVMGKCAMWVSRIIRRFDILDEDTLTLVKWTLDLHEVTKIAQAIASEVGMSDQDELEGWVEKCLDDLDELPDRGSSALARVGKRSRRRLQRLICETLEDRANRSIRGVKSATEKNFLAIQKMFDLTVDETELCLFLFVISAWSVPGLYFDGHLDCKTLQGRKYLLAALDMGEDRLEKTLHGTLDDLGMIENSDFAIELADYYRALMYRPDRSLSQKNFFLRVKPEAMPLEEHFVPREETEHILELLKTEPKTPTHILLYGDAGTGKTSYARGLVAALDLEAYEIVKGNEENAVSHRRAAILACLNITNSGKNSLIVVDEADALLNTEDSWFLRGETLDKGWLNDLLEREGVRMIWITNRIHDIDSSVIRRFAYSLHFRSFTKRQRLRVWENILRRRRVRRLFTDADIDALATRYNVSAGAIDLAVEKATQLGTRDRTKIQKAIALGLEAHRTLINAGTKVRDRDRIEENYSLAGLNIQGDLDSMLRHLEEFDRYLRCSFCDENRSMNLLFYGPPGTGKSELARYIARRLNRGIHTKRASDILSPWVGMTEINIARIFEEAEREEAVLVIDEADSLIFSRGQAVRSWEISQTNEFLAQMERYRGILICTTNLFQNLDIASIRRFNYKIEFLFLKPDGVFIFYDKLLRPLAGSPLKGQVRERLMSLTDLAPGDFKVVRDRFSFLPPCQVTHEAMVEALEQEASVKRRQVGTKEFGFLSQRFLSARGGE